MSRSRSALLVVAVLLLVQRPFVEAQGTILGTFRWQLQPYCNVITATVVQLGGIYQVNGTDDQCGATRVASVVGLAFPNPDGSIGFGLTTVTTPGGAPLHTDARISIATISGTWSDNAAHSGTFAFVPGGGTGGSPRPGPTTAISPGSVTTTELADGSVTTAKLAAAAVTATQLANSAVGNAQIATSAVTTSKIAPSSITSSKIATGALTAALQCVDSGETIDNVNAGATRNTVAPACPAGYTQTGTNCESSTWQMPFVYFSNGTCSAQNNSSGTAQLRASRTCCRVP